MIKNLPAVQATQEMQVQSLHQEDSLKKAMAPHSNILAWRITSTEKLADYEHWANYLQIYIYNYDKYYLLFICAKVTSFYTYLSA